MGCVESTEQPAGARRTHLQAAPLLPPPAPRKAVARPPPPGLTPSQLRALKQAVAWERRAWELVDRADVLGLRQWLRSGGDCNSSGMNGSLLHHAALKGKMACMDVLLDSGADIEARSSAGMPLHVAVWNYQLGAVYLLVQRGADVQARHNGKTAAQLAQDLGFGDISMPHCLQPPSSQAAAAGAHAVPSATTAAAQAAAGPCVAAEPPAACQGLAEPTAPPHLPMHVAAVAADAELWTVPPTAPPASPTLLARLNDSAGSLMVASKGTSVSMGSSGEGIVASDPLLAWCQMRASRQSMGSGTQGSGSGQAEQPLVAAATAAMPTKDHSAGMPSAGSGSSGTSKRALVDVHPWLIQFSELRFLRPIGSGSFGSVYLAVWNSVEVAVKVLLSLDASQQPPPPQQDSGGTDPASLAAALTLSSPVLANLQREAALMAALRHPNCVQLYGVCTLPPAMVTEYCERGSLADVLLAARLSPERATEMTWARRLSMALDAATGLLYLHRRGIVHRDIKSPNIMVDAYWRAKVADFNLSKLVEESNSRLSSMAALNPRWLAPEVLRGEPHSPAADTFALGVVCWELMTWELPWSDDACRSPWQLVGKLMAGAALPIPPRDQLPWPDAAAFAGLDAYVRLLQRCCSQVAAERPPLVEVVRALRELLEPLTGG